MIWEQIWIEQPIYLLLANDVLNHKTFSTLHAGSLIRNSRTERLQETDTGWEPVKANVEC